MGHINIKHAQYQEVAYTFLKVKTQVSNLREEPLFGVLCEYS
jgi:hypothetical protein